MIIYTSTKSEFRKDVRENRIEKLILEAYKRNLGHSTSNSEIKSWKNSMMYMSNILDDRGIPDSAGIAIEYKIPQTSKRIDFILTGQNDQNKNTAVIVELKQWSDAKLTEKDGIVKTFIGGSEREANHPSYQAWTYAAFLEDFNEAVQKQSINLKPCAYLHNLESENVIKNVRYHTHLQKAPSFIRTDAEKLTSFIKQFIRYGDTGKVIYEIDNGKVKPSKNLADKLLSMLQGNEEFLMIDDQKIVFEAALSLSQLSTVKDKHVLIVEGGPGTGKSVVAINLLVELTNRRLLTRYVTKNAAPRAVYESVLTGSFTKSHISNLFSGSGAYTNCDSNIFDVLIVDEAHRLNEKSGLYQNIGENQIKEIIRASKCSIFFIDEDQRVTWKDIGEIKEIENWADCLGATVHCMELQSQFRCNGSDGYLAWLNNVFKIRETENKTLAGIDFDFQVFDSPKMLHDAILSKNLINNKARLVAGYCWDWISKKPENKNKNDIVIDKHNFAAQWNLKTDSSLWIRKPDSVNEIGCIHTCQGLEVDYIGVFIGPDLIIRDGEPIIRPEQRAKTDQSLKGYKKALKIDPEDARNRAETIVKNTYRTLMSRGQKGCYIYCIDHETNRFFKDQAKRVAFVKQQKIDVEDISVNQAGILEGQYKGLKLRILRHKDVKPFENAVPIYDIKIAAGQFSDEQQIDEFDWVELPDSFRPQKGHFVTRVIGESMNKRIPNGAWCLFKENPIGSRNGKVVLAQHREIYDSETGGHFTVKLYQSDKEYKPDGSWHHTQIKLYPDSYLQTFKPIIIYADQADDLLIVAELIAVFA